MKSRIREESERELSSTGSCLKMPRRPGLGHSRAMRQKARSSKPRGRSKAILLELSCRCRGLCIWNTPVAGTLARSWNRSGAAGTQTSTYNGMPVLPETASTASSQPHPQWNTFVNSITTQNNTMKEESEIKSLSSRRKCRGDTYRDNHPKAIRRLNKRNTEDTHYWQKCTVTGMLSSSYGKWKGTQVLIKTPWKPCEQVKPPTAELASPVTPQAWHSKWVPVWVQTVQLPI